MRLFCQYAHIDIQIDLGSKAWNKTHVPPSALSRFYIEPHLHAHTDRIFNVDGDTFFVRDPTDLMRFVPAENTLAGAEDISYFTSPAATRFGSHTRAYFAGQGIDGSQGYLNSGLLSERRGA
jgi:lipopolysaccharide biosynthesis glycosyltransferase